MTRSKRITLIHATPVAIEPIRQAFAADWPEPLLVNILDDGLTASRSNSDELDEATKTRFVDLASYAHRYGADAVLFTCSAFGPAIELAARTLPIPVLKPNEAMFESAMSYGTRIAMVVTFAPAASTMEEEFAAEAKRLGSPARLETVFVPGAMDALRAGNASEHDRLVVEQAPSLGAFDAVMLAQFSTSRAAEALRAAIRVPVLTSPGAAVAKLRRIMLAEE